MIRRALAAMATFCLAVAWFGMMSAGVAQAGDCYTGVGPSWSTGMPNGTVPPTDKALLRVTNSSTSGVSSAFWNGVAPYRITSVTEASVKGSHNFGPGDAGTQLGGGDVFTQIIVYVTDCSSVTRSPRPSPTATRSTSPRPPSFPSPRPTIILKSSPVIVLKPSPPPLPSPVVSPIATSSPIASPPPTETVTPTATLTPSPTGVSPTITTPISSSGGSSWSSKLTIVLIVVAALAVIGGWLYLIKHKPQPV